MTNVNYVGKSVGEYEEHEKRAWSVDFSRTEPSLLVSGGDDCKVLLSYLSFGLYFEEILRLLTFESTYMGYPIYKKLKKFSFSKLKGCWAVGE